MAAQGSPPCSVRRIIIFLVVQGGFISPELRNRIEGFLQP